MAHRSKRMREIDSKIDKTKVYSLEEAIDHLKKCPVVKFDQSIEVAIQLGVDSKKSDQQVRGTVSLPYGTGRSRSVLVFAKGDKIKEALDAGADHAGAEELLEKVKGGWVDFDAVISTPDMMREVGKLGKVLGPKGLMPTPKSGTVTTDIRNAVEGIKKGKNIEFKVDKFSLVNNAVGKLSFATKDIAENIRTLLAALLRAKPSSSKGQYFLTFSVSSTMGPGLRIDSREIPTT
jgi:large subunit ribosomal protein L1